VPTKIVQGDHTAEEIEEGAHSNEEGSDAVPEGTSKDDLAEDDAAPAKVAPTNAAGENAAAATCTATAAASTHTTAGSFSIGLRESTAPVGGFSLSSSAPAATNAAQPVTGGFSFGASFPLATATTPRTDRLQTNTRIAEVRTTVHIVYTIATRFS
jgi:hypothetical protein